jgi:hypothetical protein
MQRTTSRRNIRVESPDDQRDMETVPSGIINKAKALESALYTFLDRQVAYREEKKMKDHGLQQSISNTQCSLARKMAYEAWVNLAKAMGGSKEDFLDRYNGARGCEDVMTIIRCYCGAFNSTYDANMPDLLSDNEQATRAAEIFSALPKRDESRITKYETIVRSF